MERLKCMICGRTILETLLVPTDHHLAKGAACSNEYGFHAGLIFYKFLGESELAEQPKERELILN